MRTVGVLPMSWDCEQGCLPISLRVPVDTRSCLVEDRVVVELEPSPQSTPYLRAAIAAHFAAVHPEVARA